MDGDLVVVVEYNDIMMDETIGALCQLRIKIGGATWGRSKKIKNSLMFLE